MDLAFYWRLCDPETTIATENGGGRQLETRSTLVGGTNEDMMTLAKKISGQFLNYSFVDPEEAVKMYYLSWLKESPDLDQRPGTVCLVYDGTFAPVHYGHIDAIGCAVRYIRDYHQGKDPLAEIILQITANHQDHLHYKMDKKSAAIDAAAHHRYNMLRLALESEEFKKATDGFPITINFFESSTTAPLKTNCLQSICRALHSMKYQTNKVWFLVGDDASYRLRHQLCLNVNVLVAIRTGEQNTVINTIKDFPPHLLKPPHLHFVTPNITNMSSTAIRKYIKQLDELNDTPSPSQLNQLVQIAAVSQYLIDNRIFRRHPKVIAISGTSGCGKTTLTKIVAETLSTTTKTIILQTDDHLKKHTELPAILDLPYYDHYWVPWDTPDGINWTNFFSNFEHHLLNQPDIIFLEGAHLLANKRALNSCDHIFYLDTDIEICKQRRLNRKRNKEPEHVRIFLQYWERYMVPFAESNRKVALLGNSSNITIIQSNSSLPADLAKPICIYLQNK